MPRLLVFVSALTVLACARTMRPTDARTVTEELTCSDSTVPRALYRRATLSQGPDSLAGLVIRLRGAPPHGRFDGAQVQLWGANWGAGGFVDSLDTYSWMDKPAGLYSLRAVTINNERIRWHYAVTLRAGFVDTAVVIFGERCSKVWRR